MSPQRRARLVALLASALLHAGLLAMLVLAPPPRPPAAATEAVELDVNYVAPRPERTPDPEPSPAKISSQPQKPSRVHRERRAPAATATADVEAPRAGGGRAPAASAPDVPRTAADGSGPATSLDLALPSRTGAWALGAGGGARKDGETWRNEPGGYPDPDAVRAAGAAEGKRNIDGWIADGMATRRAETGADPYFSALGKALEAKATEEAQQLLSGDPKKDFLNAWQDGASRYAARGNPYSDWATPGPAPQIDGDTPLSRSAQQFQGSGLAKGQALLGGGIGPDALKQKLEMGRMLRDFADGKFGNHLLAVVEIRQGGDGELLQLTLQQPSGNAAFDAHVMRSAPAAIGAGPPPPASGIGIHAEGLRSTWSFEGRIVYKRKLSEMNALRDGWYLALLGATGLATGTFDETTGEIEVPDFRYPEFRLKVKLLKVY